ARHGRLPWAALFEPAIRVAAEGFEISPRLAQLITRDPLLRTDAGARALFFRDDGSPRQAGDTLRNAELAATFRTLAKEGPGAFYRGDIARDIVAAASGHASPGDLADSDLAAYK